MAQLMKAPSERRFDAGANIAGHKNRPVILKINVPTSALAIRKNLQRKKTLFAKDKRIYLAETLKQAKPFVTSIRIELLNNSGIIWHNIYFRSHLGQW